MKTIKNTGVITFAKRTSTVAAEAMIEEPEEEEEEFDWDGQDANDPYKAFERRLMC